MTTNASGMSRPRARAAAGPTAGSANASGSTIALELVLGLAFGVLLPLGVNALVRFRLLGAEPKLRPLLPPAQASFEPLGGALAELAKFTALLVFGALPTPRLFGDLSWDGYAAVVLAIFQSGIPQDEEAFTLVGVCIAFSIIAHGSTDVPIARAFDVDDLTGIPDGPNRGHTGSKAPQPLGGTGET